MDRRLYVVAGFTVSLTGSFIGFLLLLASQKYAIPNPNAAYMVFTLLIVNILVNACALAWAYAWWLEKEQDYYRYGKERTND